MIKMGSFRSYVGLEEYEMKVPAPKTTAFLQPKFLSGELVVAEAHKVLKFTSLNKRKGLNGSLFVTNARLVFVSQDDVLLEDSIPLLSINSLCYYEEPKAASGTKSKRKVRLDAQILGGSLNAASPSLFCAGSTRIHELLVICSNFRTFRVSFKFSLMDQGQKICNALIHWTFPKQPEKLFYMDYCRVLDWKCNYGNSLPLYNIPGDWLREMKTCRTSSGYRISMSNINFEICESLPETIVVPANLTDVRLGSLASKLKGNRPPFWVWGDFKGSAILRMSKLHNEADSTAENVFYETLRGAHPTKQKPHISDLDAAFPVREIRVSLSKLLEICCPESLTEFIEIDGKFLTHLENTKWLSWSSKVLQLCSDLAEKIVRENAVVILQENESRDTSCLISAVTQLVVDARFRTVNGFFSLIQKEWVSVGHAFHSEYMHTSPIFLLFLDTVFQLSAQNPFDFEFNDQLLKDIWDSCFDSTTGTFLFDSPCQRKHMELRKDLTIWHRILSKEDRSVDEETGGDVFRQQYPNMPSIPKSLLNPMYKLKSLLYPPSTDGGVYNYAPLLSCFSGISEIRLWDSLYLSRTQEVVPIVTRKTQKLSSNTTVPYIMNTKNTNSPRPQTSRISGSAGSTASCNSPNQGSVFLFSTNEINSDPEQGTQNIPYSPGRDPMVETKLVDLLLTVLSRSTRYRRNSQGLVSSGYGGGRRSSSAEKSPSPASQIVRRHNPFADS